jgi:pimeloyl-ACP methyl ester carboxylesterase
VNIGIKGTYTIHGRYCEPKVVVAGNKDILQLLVHGIARDHHYWNAYDYDGAPIGGTNFSWVARSSLHGYPTFAIDRLGHGLSSSPNPNTTVQLPAQVEVTHQLIKSISSGSLGRKFSEILFVGHSFGSVLGQLFTAKYPGDIKRIILTGWASVNLLQLGTLAGQTGAARDVDSRRFENLPYGYLLSTNATNDGLLTNYRFGTSSASRFFNDILPSAAFANRQTSTTGELYTVAFAITQAVNFRGKVFVATGQNDAYWCGTPAAADCGQGASSAIAAGKNVYPNAMSYDYINPAQTGHELLSHYTQNQTFDAVFQWLSRTV